MKVVFMGTPDFAVPALQKLIQEHDVVCVYTREPKIAGRGKQVNKTPVHVVAENLGIEVRTPKSLRDIDEQNKFAELNADVAVVAAYGLILPLPILKAYPLGCLNIHASLLPRWRGAAPIQRCIEAGDTASGVTIMQVAEGLDTGDMLHRGIARITPETTGEVLHDELAVLGADLISEVLADVNKYPPIKQNDIDSCYASKIEKSECKIDFSLDAETLCRKIKAFSPYPGMFFEYNGERFKILYAEKSEQKLEIGQIYSDENKLLIGCKDCAINISKIQRQGKKNMNIDELLRGFSFENGCIIK